MFVRSKLGPGKDLEHCTVVDVAAVAAHSFLVDKTLDAVGFGSLAGNSAGCSVAGCSG